MRLSFLTYWMLLAVNYSWSLGTNKFLYQAKKYIFPLEIIPRGTYSLLTIFPPCGPLSHFPSSMLLERCCQWTYKLGQNRNPSVSAESLTQRGVLHFFHQNKWKTSLKGKYLFIHCFKKLNNLLFHIPHPFSDLSIP